MAQAQKPHFIFRRNGRVHLNRCRASVQSITGSGGVRSSVSNAGYTMFPGSVKSIVYPLHSPVSSSLPLPCVTMCHHISTGPAFLTTYCLILRYTLNTEAVCSSGCIRGLSTESYNTKHYDYREIIMFTPEQATKA